MALLSQCRKDDPVVNIPDDNFLNALIELGVDTNGDGLISPEEAEAVTCLDVRGSYHTPGEIENMQGIEAFINLDTLICWYNNLTTLDVSNNIALTRLECGGNQLTTLDVSKNIKLEWLSCGVNQLTTIDVSNNTSLKALWCSYNQLITLDVSNNTKLT